LRLIKFKMSTPALILPDVPVIDSDYDILN
jgi:hypothetical protein